MNHKLPSYDWEGAAAAAVENAKPGDVIIVHDEIQRKVVTTAIELRRPHLKDIRVSTKAEHDQTRKVRKSSAPT